jgi:hypothetical protein
MPDIISLSCPSCGHKLQISDDVNRFACAACGNEQVVIRRGGIVYLQPVNIDKRVNRVKTWGQRSFFEYYGSVENGTEIVFGKGWKVNIKASDYIALRSHFRDRIIPIGTSRTDAPKGSLGEWLEINLARAGIACYVGVILVLEGYAKRVGKHDICVIK